MSAKKINIVIPSYCPSEVFVELVEKLDSLHFPIILVDDGSGESYQSIFEKLTLLKNVDLIRHSKNQGKGAALKSAFKHLQENDNSKLGCITVDADGQHLVEDIVRIEEYAARNPDGFLMGVREFSKDVPLRSKFGNVMTLYVLRLFYGLSLADSQTGLRYIPSRYYSTLGALRGDRYDFELQCILKIHELKEPITQLPITTVYIEDNESSHFRPIVDSYRVYSVFLKFSLSSVVSFSLDIGLFSILLALTGGIMLSTVCARVISGGFNFYLNRNFVFSRYASKNIFGQLIGYFLLWLVLMLSSGWLVAELSSGTEAFIVGLKIIIDISLFIVSYQVQKRFVFRA